MAFSQSAYFANTNANAYVLSFSSATAGSTTIIAGVMQWGGTNRNYTWTDDGSNTYTKLTKSSNGRHSQISYVESASAATDLTNTVDAGGAQPRSVWAIEVDNAATFDVEDTFDNTSDTSTHHCADTVSIDTVANVFIVSSGAHNADSGAMSPASGFTELGDNAFAYVQYGYFTGAQMNQRASYTSATARQSSCCIASFADPAGGGISIPVVYHHRQRNA